MNDRSRGIVATTPASADAGDGPRDSWVERLLQRLHLKSRDAARDDLDDALAEVTNGEHALSLPERAMLRNVLGLHRIRADDVMLPRADIVAVSAETSLGELLRVFRTAGHSRLPVYGETLDDPKGMVHIRDFLDHIAERAEAGSARRAPAADAPANGATPRPRRSRSAKVPNLGDVDLGASLATTRILRPVLFVPPSMPAMDLLVRMQATRTHMALVIDEYGGTDGLISIEDLIEVVVGDIEDEHDVAEGRLVVRAEGEGEAFLADARAGLKEVSAACGVDLEAAVGDMAEEVDTIGGLIVTLAGRVPSRGELISGPEDLEFEIVDADPRRVKRLRIYRRPDKLAPAAPLALPAPPLALPPPASEGAPPV